jgi:predicted phosphoribosyltransferase
VFKDRKHAGRELSKKLSHLRAVNPLVLAIPRGGVPVGYEIAKALQADFSLIIVRKLPFPYNPESGFGAIAEDGSSIILNQAKSIFSSETIETIIEEQKKEIKRRRQVLRGGHPIPEISDRTVILVDDGIAMGSTMLAAIEMIKNQKPKSLIVAVPVSSPEIGRAIDNQGAVDETIILEQPRYFRAVAQVYENWRDIPDYEVISIMKEWQRGKKH